MRWVIGDIHGMLVPLESLLANVRRADRGARFYFVGDYVNRGPHSKGVLDLLVSLDDARFCRGNHDDVFDLVLNGQCLCPESAGTLRANAVRFFSAFGLIETLNSYGISNLDLYHWTLDPSESELDRLLAPIPPAHRQFIRGLPPVIEESDFFVAHARWPVHEPTEFPPIVRRLEGSPELIHTILWGRFPQGELMAAKAWGRRGFFGHTPVFSYTRAPGSPLEPIISNKMVLLDTAAALRPDGRLSAFCADTGIVIHNTPKAIS